MRQATYKLFRCLRKAVAWLALLILLLHASTSLLLSHINYFRAKAGELLSNRFNTQIHIGHLNGSLPFINPEIEITNLALEDKTLHSVQKIQSMSLQLDLFASLWNRKLILKQAAIDHISIKLTKDQKGWHVQGLPDNQNKTDPLTILSDLFSIKHITLENTNITIFDKLHKTENVLYVQKLVTWKETHKAFLTSQLLLNNSPAEIDATFNIRSNTSDVTGFSTYLTSDSLSLSPWIHLFSPEKTPLSISSLPVSTHTWFHWQPQSWKITSQFITPEAQLTVNEKPLTIKQLKGTLWAHGTSLTDWVAQFHTSDFSLNASNYPKSDAFIESNTSKKGAQLTVAIPSIKVDAIKKTLLASSLLPPFYQDLFKQLNPEGILSNSIISFNPSQHPFDFKATTTLQDISIDAWNGTPSASNISGHVMMNAHQGIIDIDSKNSALGLTDIFNAPWKFNTIKGRFYWKLSPETYTLYTPDTTTTSTNRDSSDITTGHTQLKLDIPINPDKPVYMTLKTGADQLSAQDAQQYLPFKVLPNDLAKWLQKSVPKGTICNSTFLWHGPLEDPKPGNFTWGLNLNLKDGQFHYSPDWPDIHHTNATLHLNQKGLSVQNANGIIYNTPVHNINVTIDDFDKSILQLSANGLLSGKDSLTLFRDTPINKVLNNAPQSWDISGDFDTDFKLTLPLTGNTPPSVNVIAKTDNGQFSIPSQKVDLQALKGEILYSTKNGLEASNVQAHFLNHPATLSIHNEVLGGKENMTSILLKSHSNFNDIKTFIPEPLQSFAEGSFDYQAQVGIPAKGPYFIDIKSNLKGLSVNLPPPFNKNQKAPTLFNLLITPKDSQQLTLIAEYGQQRHAIFNIQGGQLTSGHIAFGSPTSEKLKLPKAGISLSGKFDEININSWYDWYQQHKSLLTPTTKATNTFSVSANNLKIDKISYDKHTVNHVSLNGNINNSNLFANIQSDQITGIVSKKENQPFTITLDSLKLPESLKNITEDLSHNHNNTDQTDALSQMNPALFPTMQVNIKNLLIGNNRYGHMKFNLEKLHNGLRLNQLNASLGGLDINGLLTWKTDSTSTVTGFKGTLETNDLNKVFKNWNYTNSNFRAKKVKLKVNESWPGSPAGFNFEKSEGQANIEMRNGQLSSAKETDSLHVLGLFNIDAIARRFRLDFSDLYDSGVSFDTITGNISFDKGLINFDTPLVIDGPSSDFTIEGAINLPEQFLDLGMIITLPVTQNLPIISLLIGQPVIAGAIYLFDKLVGKTLMKFTSVRYDIVGPIADPKIMLDKLFSNKLKNHNAQSVNDNVQSSKE